MFDCLYIVRKSELKLFIHLSLFSDRMGGVLTREVLTEVGLLIHWLSLVI